MSCATETGHMMCYRHPPERIPVLRNVGSFIRRPRRGSPSLERPTACAGLASHLGHCALRCLLVRPPPQKLRSMPEPAASEVIVLDLSHQHRLERMPLAYPVSKLRPDLARLPPCESGRLDRVLHNGRKLLALWYGRFNPLATTPVMRGASTN